MRCFVTLTLLTRLAWLADAQTVAAAARAPSAAVSGVVRDSIARIPLAGAVVQLVASDSVGRFGASAISDSLGRFTIDGVPDGHYALGFFHPMLDSLGLEPTLREVFVADHRPVRADLSIPSPARLRAAICGAGDGPASDTSGVVVGFVRDAQSRAPAAGVSVSGQWLELSLSRTGLTRRIPKLVATTGSNGWFALCNIPRTGMIALMATRGADSTDLIEAEVPAEGFLRRELYLGPSRIVVTGDSAGRTDSTGVAVAPRRRRLGDGHVSGTVVTASDGRPIASAQVSVGGGSTVHVNERGEWTLLDAPLGTRTFEVRAVGYYPVHRWVDVIPNTAPVRVALSTMKAVMDTVRITAARLADRHHSGFADRQRSGVGRFLTADDIARRAAMVTTDLFRVMPGVRLDRSVHDSTSLLVRGGVDDWCTPAVFLDGFYIQGATADDIDTWVTPAQIAGMEIYTGISAPMQFQPRFNGCGSIVIWTK